MTGTALCSARRGDATVLSLPETPFGRAAPEGPQRGDLPVDFRAALEANPEAGAFFDGIAQFYRTAYLRYIDATKRRPDLRVARIAEVVAVLAANEKDRRS